MQRFEVRARALTWDEAQLHQAACGIVDEDQQRARHTPALEPAMLAAVDLNESAPTLTSQPLDLIYTFLLALRRSEDPEDSAR